MDTMVNQLEKEINYNFQQNKVRLGSITRASVEWDIFDSLIEEIIICITIGSSQAAITLINHLLEKVMKVGLYYKNYNKHLIYETKKVQEEYKEFYNKYGDSDLSQTINCSKSQSIISKDQSEKLHFYCRTLRNPFGHANSIKTFGDSKRKVVSGNFHGNVVNCDEVNVSHFLLLQSNEQKKIANKECVGYFNYVVGIIIEYKKKFFLKGDLFIANS